MFVRLSKALLFATGLLCVHVVTVEAQSDIYVRGAGRLIPLALPQLCATDGAVPEAKAVPETMRRDLDLSGFFEIVNPASYIETAGKCGSQESTAYSDWSVINTEGLIKGQVSVVGNRAKVQLYLHDVQKQVVVLAKEYEGDATKISVIAHKFANEVMKYYTGEAGIFGTQIAFSSRVGRFKELFVMDMDGSNVRQLTNERGLAISPAWDPSGTKIAYTSYRNRVPDVFILDAATRGTKQVTRTVEMDIAAHFVPSGNQLLMSRTEGSESDIVLMNTDGTAVRKLTSPNRAIDVSPFPSPDGSMIAFCSNRGGGPQIYTMGADGSGAKRVSFVSSNYCTSPAWSPKGDKIAFVCMADGNFQLFVSNVDGSNPVQLTSAGSNEDPEWSPDGRYLIFASTYWTPGIYSIALIRDDGTNIKRITTSRSGDFEPAWSTRLP
jgi:TolB protein